MPEIDFAPENRRESGTPDFNFFKLKVNETARVVLFEKPKYAWVHTLRAPKIVDGVAVKVQKERRGEKYLDYDLDFIGRPLCMGDYGIVEDKGGDPANCPVCKAAKDGAEVGPPERRFAINLIRYKLDHNGKPVLPFSCSCEVWCFTEGYYDKLCKIAEEHGQLLGRDLILGPCQIPENYQRFDVNAGARSVWTLSEEIKALVLATFKNQRQDGLERACGRSAERRYVERDLETIEERWAVARGVVSPDATRAMAGADLPNLTQGLDALLNQSPGTLTATAATDVAGLLNGVANPVTTAPPSDDPFGDLLGTAAPAAPAAPAEPGLSDLFTSAVPTAPPAAPAPPPPAPPAAPTEQAIDFEALLNSL
jgi:hypothetical protein